MLKTKKKTTINVNELEKPKEKKAFIEVDLPLESDDFLKSSDVNVFEFCTKFLTQSNRLCFIVNNDKIEFANNLALRHCEISNHDEIKGKHILDFIDKKHWDTMSSNLGTVLTNNQTIKIKMAKTAQTFEFKALYLPNKENFAFFFISEPIYLQNGDSNVSLINSIMYDEVTNLPSFLLFEDRLQNAINHEIYKDGKIKKHLVCIAVIDLIEDTKNIELKEAIRKKVAYNLAQGIKKNYTVSSGIKHTFWLLLDDLVDEKNLQAELEKIKEILKTPVKHGIDEYYVQYKMAQSVFPQEAKSARKLLEQAMENIKKS